MAVSSLSLSFASKSSFTNSPGARGCINPSECAAISITKCSKINSFNEENECTVSGNSKRRALILGIGGALTLNSFQSGPLLAEGTPENYNIFVDKADGYSYYYPSDWRDFDFRGHDSAFKDRSLQLQNVRLSFIPTTKSDICDLGPMDESIPVRLCFISSMIYTLHQIRLQTYSACKSFCNNSYWKWKILHVDRRSESTAVEEVQEHA